jgi:predicted esterase
MQNYFTHPQQLRYFTLQDRNPEDCNHLVIALHGYGQLAKYFIEKFKSLAPTVFILVPEGPHRFYLEGSSGRVGASWMTKEARELDIENNLAWLNALMMDFTSKHSFDKISLLGFSQGGATAARWYQQNPKQFDRLILWATVFPPDIERGTFTSNHSMHFVLGYQDEYYQGSDAEALKNSYVNLGFKVHAFEGTHDIDSKVLTKILALPFHGI